MGAGVFIAIAVVATIVSSVFTVIQLFNPPKPAKITFGYTGTSSPRYGSFVLDNTVSNEIAVPVLYGQLKLAGNLIWQSDPGTTINKIIGLCEGQIQGITDIRANDIVINDTNTPGSNYTVYLGNATQGADSRLPASLQPDMALHNLAYIALTLTASDQLKGGNPTITSVVQGLLIEIWDGSAWGAAGKIYSENPVACIRDFMISSQYGLGIAKTSLDDASWGDSYNYCEGMVDVPNSTPEARFRLDYIVDSKRAAQDILNEMLSTFGGYLIYSGNKIKLRVDRPDDPIVQYFGDGSTTKQNAQYDPNNIVHDSFAWNMSSIDQRPNRIKIQYVDPAQNYVKVYAQIEDRIDQDDRGTVIPQEISMLGIIRATQALRVGRLYMAVAKYTHANITFAARLESIQCEVGDIVAVTHQSSKFTRKLFRITTMQEGEDEQIMFNCREFNPAIYDDHQGAAVLTMQQPAGPNLYAPLSDVTGLTLSENDFKNKDGTIVTNILVSWTAPSADQLLRLDRYIIQISSDGGLTYRDAALASRQKTSYNIVMGNVQTGITYTVRVKTVSDRGAESPGTTGSITITGKISPISDVQDFDVQFAFNHLTFTWSAVDDYDLFGYEIRVGGPNSTWETAGIVATEILTNKYTLLKFTSGAKKYFVKAIDSSGNYSANAASDSITITAIPQSNVVFNFDIFSRITNFPNPLEGVLSSGMVQFGSPDYDPTYYRETIGPKTTKLWSDIQSTYATMLALQNSGLIFGRETYSSVEQSYQTTPIDLGAVFNANYILDFQAYSTSNLGSVTIDIATSSDNITYTAFLPFVNGQYNARYIKFRFRIQSMDGIAIVRLISAYLTIDVPDRDQSFLNQIVGAGGSTISLSGFTKVKSIVVTTVGTSALTPRIDDQSNLPNSFLLKLTDTGGSLQPGNANIYVKGY